ncbi:tyrosine-type recombinase/integrase [Maridesulfovibrio sp.]|uniref:tyrosine-type recombinase/integrase n=1 Tax=Maridesulfovibrio sp. TaxID=2795000 RepID=UPI0039F1310F
MKWINTTYPGVRYREHKTRKHGVRPDRYFSIRYYHNKKRIEEGLGWASAGWTVEKVFDGQIVTETVSLTAELAASIRAEFRNAARTGQGAETLKAKREDGIEQKKQKKREQAKLERENVSFSDFFHNTYFPQAELSKKPKTYKGEFQHVRDWIGPAVGDKPIKEIDADDLTKIRLKISKAGRSKRTAQHVLSTFRIVWNHAKDRKLVSGDCPVKSIKLGKLDNERVRFLEPEEVQKLLEEVASSDQKAYNITLAAVTTGARLGELSSLTWGNVNLQKRTLTFVHTKTAKPRTVPITTDLINVLIEQERGKPGELVFTNCKGEKWKEQPWAFRQAVKRLGFNEGRESRKEHITFHSLRHTAASLMLTSGVDVTTLQELFGWSTLQMIQRYTHATNDAKLKAVEGLGKLLSNHTGKVIPIRESIAGG